MKFLILSLVLASGFHGMPPVNRFANAWFVCDAPEENPASYRLIVDGQTCCQYAGDQLFFPASLPSGTHSIQMVAVSAAGVESDPCDPISISIP